MKIVKFGRNNQVPVSFAGNQAGDRNWRSARGERAFTMIEIAISLAVIGFALVAIIGILPLAMNVQKENKQDTIINQDEIFLMDAIRHGVNGITNTAQGYAGEGLDDLTNYFGAISNYWGDYDVKPNKTNLVTQGVEWYTPTNSYLGNSFSLNTGFPIIGLLSTPKYFATAGGGFHSNHIVSFVRALSGAATEKYPQTNSAIMADAFSYRLISEVLPYHGYESDFATNVNDPGFLLAKNLETNLHEIKLTFRYPLLPNGDTGSGRQVYRVAVGGTHVPTTYNGRTVYFFQPQTYAQITNSVP